MHEGSIYHINTMKMEKTGNCSIQLDELRISLLPFIDYLCCKLEFILKSDQGLKPYIISYSRHNETTGLLIFSF